MDPDAALTELLDIARAIDNAYALTGDQAVDMAVRFLGLHEWLTGGGYLPAAWRNGASAAEHGGE